MTMSREELEQELRAESTEALERLRFATALAQSGLQYLTVVNGGALVALFTLIGTGKLAYSLVPLWTAFGAFVMGITAALTAYLFGYLSQNKFYFTASYRAMNLASQLGGRPQEQDAITPQNAGMRMLNFSIAAAAASILLFVVGAGLALVAFT
jgi:hypothetical protein